MYFNLEEEKLRPMPLPLIPEDWDGERTYSYFGESMGHLHLIDNVYNLQTPYFDVYEMEMDYSGWFVKFRVDMFQLPIVFPETIRRKNFQPENLGDYDFSLLCVVRTELDDESYLVLQIKGKVIRYNFKTRTFSKICDVEAGCARRNKAVRLQNRALVMLPELSDVYQFIESLAFV